ncbi:MAG: MBL fold metallo-hydrolase [Clostridiales bacterium]|nr:MBL fold metallo-hydrolase [Clostridiales bacterium]
MKLTYFGHSTFEIAFENLTVVTDPCSIGYPKKPARADVVTESHQHHDHNDTTGMEVTHVLSTAGEWEIGGVKFSTVSTWHDPEGGKLRGDNRIFVIEAEGLRIAHLGDMGEANGADSLSDIDVLLIPVGGYYTISTDEAYEIVRRIQPKVVIPMHFKTECIDYPIETVDRFAGMTKAEFAASSAIEITKDAIDAMPGAVVLPYMK